MKNICLIILFVSAIFTSGSIKSVKPKAITSVEIEHIIEDSLLNVRALEVIKETQGAFFLTSKGTAGHVYRSVGDKAFNVVYPIAIAPDTASNNFRSLAVTSKNGFALSIESPARLYKIKNDEKKLVYQDNHPKAFYDALNFWNDKEGIAIGDSTDGCLSMIITRDGGNKWNKVLCENLPKGMENEGAFAASDTNIAIVGDKTWVATNTGRIYYSPNKGETWSVFDTPIVKEKETEGIYAVDFYDELNGFAIGGDYTKPESNKANKIRTSDGGKTWSLVANGVNPGYRSCVQYIPNSYGEKLVAVGFKGIDVSNDAGDSWSHISDESFYTIRFINDSTAYSAGAGRVSKLHFK
jgi:photosystem II stability/assembly factor-like uncharacterized protein